MRLVFPLVFVAACGGGTGPCTPEERAGISAKFIAAVKLSCSKENPLASCEAYPALKKRYEEERASWVLCSRK